MGFFDDIAGAVGDLGNSTLEAIKNTPFSEIGKTVAGATISDAVAVASKVTPSQVATAIYGPPAPSQTVQTDAAMTAQKVVEASAIPLGLLALGFAAYYFTRK